MRDPRNPPETARPNTRRAFIKSFGCQMNVYDATRMADALAPDGWSEASSPEDADLIVLNTCHIRERAAEKVFSELGRLARVKDERAAEGRPLQVAVAGCVAQAEGAEVIRRQPAVDLVIGPQAYHRLPDLLRRASTSPGIVDTEFPQVDKFSALPTAPADKTRSRGVSAFLTIQEGCDKFCSFCVVPYTRGAEFSRPPESILDEARNLADAGVREITVLGQNVNAYLGTDGQGGAWRLARLVDALAAIPGVARIRYTTSHPRDMSDDLVEAHRSQPALMPFLHLPVQSGSDRILQAMNRRHTVRDFLKWIDKIRAVRPDIALSSDFIVGFPGETEEDFAATLDLVETVRFASAFSFKYSPREGTPGATFDDQVPPETMAERLARLQDALDRHRREFNAASVGSQVDVLFEKVGRHAGQVAGKTPHLQAVQVEGPSSMIGSIERVVITAAGSNSLFGRLAGQDEETA